MAEARLLPLFAWRDAVRSDRGPPKSATRQVLIEISLWMDNEKLIAWPSEEKLAAKCALSARSVRTHLKLAEAQGWISRKRFRPPGKQWAQYCYKGTLPPSYSRPEGRSGIPSPTPDFDAARPAIDDQNHRNNVPTNSQENSAMNSGSSKELPGPGREDFKKIVEKLTGKQTLNI